MKDVISRSRPAKIRLIRSIRVESCPIRFLSISTGRLFFSSSLTWQSQYHRGQKSDRFTVRGQTYDVDQERACQHFKSDF